MSTQDELLAAVRHRLEAHFGAPVALNVPEVNWDRRLVVRATLPTGQRAFVKIDFSLSRHQRETAGIRAAARAGAPVPAVLAAEAGSPALLVLAEIPNEGSLKNRDAWEAAGAATRRLHDGEIPLEVTLYSAERGTWNPMFTGLLASELPNAVAVEIVPERLAAQLLSHAERTLAQLGEPPKALIHGDLQARHVLVHGDTVSLVDFGDTGWGDAAFDLVVLTHWTPQMLPRVLAGYRASAELRARITALYETYSFWRHLFVARWYSENGFPPERSRSAARQVAQRLASRISEPSPA